MKEKLNIILLSFIFSLGTFAMEKFSIQYPLRGPRTQFIKNHYYLFVGNLGVGKTTILNAVIGKNATSSDIFGGTGYTSHHTIYLHEGRNYIDTPALDDYYMKEKAALAIEAALKKDGIYHIIFVVNIERGYLRPVDVATIQTVLDAVKLPNIKYNIIINKLKDDEKKSLQILSNQMNALAAVNSGKYKSANIMFNDYYNTSETKQEANQMKTISEGLINFINKESKWVYISPENVSALDVNK